MCASTFFLSIAHFIDMFTLPCELCELYKYFFYIFDELRKNSQPVRIGSICSNFFNIP